MMNHVQLIGRLTKDSELRYTPQGIAVATFTLPKKTLKPLWQNINWL